LSARADPWTPPARFAQASGSAYDEVRMTTFLDRLVTHAANV
jgi:hypothetical protein